VENRRIEQKLIDEKDEEIVMKPKEFTFVKISKKRKIEFKMKRKMMKQ